MNDVVELVRKAADGDLIRVSIAVGRLVELKDETVLGMIHRHDETVRRGIAYALCHGVTKRSCRAIKLNPAITIGECYPLLWRLYEHGPEYIKETDFYCMQCMLGELRSYDSDMSDVVSEVNTIIEEMRALKAAELSN